MNLPVMTFNLWIDLSGVGPIALGRLVIGVARRLGASTHRLGEHRVTTRRGKVVGRWGIYQSEQYRGTGDRS